MGLFHSPKCRLLSMLCLTFFFFLVEIIVGYLTNSTALIADSFHMLSDVVALVIAYVSVRVSIIIDKFFVSIPFISFHFHIDVTEKMVKKYIWLGTC